MSIDVFGHKYIHARVVFLSSLPDVREIHLSEECKTESERARERERENVQWQ